MMAFPSPAFIAVWTLVGTLVCTSEGGIAEPVTGDHVAAFRSSVAEVLSAATVHRDLQETGLESVESCSRRHAQYDAKVRPWLTYMTERVSALDAFISDHGGDTAADLGCVLEELTGEFDQHRSSACQLADLSLDRAEAERHVSAVTSYADHLTQRCQEMLAEFGVGVGLGWSRVWNGCEVRSKP